MGFLTPDLNLVSIVGLAIIMGIVMIFQQRNLGNMKNVWGLFTWFTLVVLPLTAVPSALNYWKISQWYFLLAVIIDILIWVVIAVKLRDKTFSDIQQYDRVIITFVLYFLVIGLILLWQIQAFDIIMIRSTEDI